MSKHYYDPNQYLLSRMCKLYKQIWYYRFECFRCRLCYFLHRYRFSQTENQFKKYSESYNIDL